MLLLTFWLCLGRGISAADFRVDFLPQPSVLSYNLENQKFQLSLRLQIAEVAQPSDRTVTGVGVFADKSRLLSAAEQVFVSHGETVGQGHLVFLCNTFLRCQQLKDSISARPLFYQRALKFVPFGLQGGLPVKFGAVYSAVPPAAADVVFQRHFDNSLSFAKSWNSYAKGFGDPRGNYWMGLEQLSNLTKDRACKLTFVGTLFNNSVLSSTYKDFQVRGADENYKLRVGDGEPGGQLYEMKWHDQMEFSTFDRDNDKLLSESCSKTWRGSVGWWYKNCNYHNPNGQIVSKADLSTAYCYKFCSGFDGNQGICLKKTKLSFRCS